MQRRAFICGISGQDGGYLARLLLGRGYDVWGSSRDAGRNPFLNLRRLGIYESVRLVSLDLANLDSVLEAVKSVRPHEIFGLAGQSSVGLSFEHPVATVEGIVLATLNLLESIRILDPSIRFCNAGSTDCYGDTGEGRATEATPFDPRSPYGVAKASASWIVSSYRQAYDIFACNAILSNHESPLRPERFATRKIVHAAALLATGREAKLSLGNLSVERDWGWAPEYVEAMAAMTRQERAGDCIIATGQSHSLLEFVETAFRLANRDWQDFVGIDERFVRPTDILRNKVDPSRAALRLGWKAACAMPEVVAKMLEEEIANLAEFPRSD